MRLTITLDVNVDKDKFERWHGAVDNLHIDVAGTVAANIDDGRLEVAGVEIRGVAVK